MLGLAKRTKAKIIQASTSEIYGDPEIHPQTEEYKGAVSINGPRACYDEGKRCAETLFWDYKRQHNVDVKVVRIFNTYGPRMQKNDGRVVSNFIVQALTNKNIKPIKKPIRGGTDGSLLTENGVPTPNIFTGMQNVHGPLEWISSTDMSLATEVMIEIIKLNSNLEAEK